MPTHAALAVRVLEAGKHCFVEKPLAQSVADAERAVAAARASGRLLMVGHLLEYHPGVRKLKEIADSGELGDIHYIYSNRLNLGQLRADENALWSLGAHDISVILHLAGEDPFEVSAHGESYMRPGIEDVVFAFLRFPSGLAAHLHLSWLDPHKERRFTVVGSQRMATFDDMDLERKVTVYDKGFDQSASSYGEYITRAGDIYSPRISNAEPLRLEVEHFVECVRTGATPRSDGESGLRVVRVLERLQAELERSRRGAERSMLLHAKLLQHEADPGRTSRRAAPCAQGACRARGTTMSALIVRELRAWRTTPRPNRSCRASAAGAGRRAVGGGAIAGDAPGGCCR